MTTLTVRSSLLVAVLVLGGCAAPSSAPPTSAPAKPTTAAAKPPAAAPAQPATAASPASKTAEKPAGDSAALYEAAKKEGKVVYYSGDDTSDIEKIQKAFAARYPGISIEGQEGQGQDAREKIIAEQAAGRVIADVVIAGGNSISELIEAGHLVPYQSPEVKNLLPGIADKRGVVNPRVVNVYGITINTNVVPSQDEPKAWKDLTDPKYLDKMAAQDPRGSGGGMYIFTGLMERYGEGFLADLSEQKIFFGKNNSQLLTDLVRGERGLLITAASGGVAKQRKSGAPIKMIKPEEGVVLIPIGMAVVKNAPHPNAAKLFIDWMLSEEGQKLIADMGDTPARKGVKAKEPESDMSGAKVLEMKYTGADRKETAELTKKWDAMFFKRG